LAVQRRQRLDQNDGGDKQVTEPVVAVWNPDGALCRRDSLLPFLTRVAGPVELTRALPGSDPAILIQRVLGRREFAEVDRIARDYAVTVARERLRRDCLDR
jgi:hypothetical protein